MSERKRARQDAPDAGDGGAESAGVSFEDSVSRLEAIVEAMESGGLTLDECLEQFEQAVRLSRLCARKLEEAERRIGVLNGEVRYPEEIPAGEPEPEITNPFTE